METVEEVMTELEKKGSEQTRKIYRRHGITGDLFGVKVGDLKPIAKMIKGKHELACELYDTKNYDAMYLAGMVADGSKMTKRQLQSWASKATCCAVAEYVVPVVACESKHARDLALKWIDSKKETTACAGWCTYSGIVSTQADDELDMAEVNDLIDRVVREIDDARNYVRYTMNGFVIAVGGYFKPLLKQAKQAAKSIGVVSVDMGQTSCKVPLATDYIKKIESQGRVGKKRKTMRC